MPTYFLDSDVLIQSKNLAYRFDIAPSFWALLEKQFHNKTIFICSFVYEELIDGDDELSDWIKKINLKEFVIKPDKEAQSIYTRIADYVNNGKYPHHHVQKFLEGADPWIIACASAKKSTVVTMEVLVANTSLKIKIPNICEYVNVPYMNLYDMMKALNFRF